MSAARQPLPKRSTSCLIVGVLAGIVVGSLPEQARCQAPPSGPLPGTSLLTTEGDLAAKMVEGIRAHLEKKTAQAPGIRLNASEQARREGPQALESLRQQRRNKLRSSLGISEKTPIGTKMDWAGGPDRPALIAEKDGIRASRVSWNVLDDLKWEGILLEPAGPPVAGCVLWPLAGQSPEEAAGLMTGKQEDGLGWQMASHGCLVIVPVLIGRDHIYSGNPSINRFTNQPHREFVYRMLYEMGRTPLGLEVESTRAAVTWLTAKQSKPVLVCGQADGGRVALAAAALDDRIAGCWARDAFGPREKMWEEPIDRNTWDLLNHVGDAELVDLIAPRFALLEACSSPGWAGPAKVPNRGGGAPGKLSAIAFEQAKSEHARIDGRAWPERQKSPVLQDNQKSNPAQEGKEAREKVLPRFLAESCGVQTKSHTQAVAPPPAEKTPYDTGAREGRQLHQMIGHCQNLWRHSEKARAKLWAQANPAKPETFGQEAAKLRDHFHQEVIGMLPAPSLPMNPKSRPWKDGKRWKGHEVTLDLEPGVFAYGILLLPNDLKPGEKRPVVVCQHGLEGRPSDVCEPEKKTAYYNSFGATLADRGYIVFAPQNCYIGQDKFRVLQRLANPLKLSLFSFIIRQHERIIDWLKHQPFTDPDKVAFYGLSYGGKTAMRVPAVLPGYCLSVCSGDFNEWVGKNVSYDFPGSYIYTGEYEMMEFNLGHTYNYAEMAWLIAPRPFLVERGHDDGVGTDEMVAWEFARVRRFYSRLRQPAKTSIAFFAGGHEVHGEESFPWLDKQLGFIPVGQKVQKP